MWACPVELCGGGKIQFCAGPANSVVRDRAIETLTLPVLCRQLLKISHLGPLGRQSNLEPGITNLEHQALRALRSLALESPPNPQNALR